MENEKSNCFVFGNSILKSVSKSVIWRSKLACDWNCEIFGDLDERLVARAGFVVGMVTFCVAILKKKVKNGDIKLFTFGVLSLERSFVTSRSRYFPGVSSENPVHK